jgi:ppGpp synthetase/RelA/SpoT-type nucleotidyltranferase
MAPPTDEDPWPWKESKPSVAHLGPLPPGWLESGDLPSNRQVDSAGELLRENALGLAVSEVDYERAAAVFASYRASFAPIALGVYTAVVANVGFAAPESRADISTRPKRLAAVAKKLVRLRRMRLSQMEDIAGCRAKLRTPSKIQDVLGRLQQGLPNVEVDDYVQNPQPTGYRAVHVVTTIEGPGTKDRLRRRVEIQLRTPGQNQWADTVEEWGDKLGYDLKNGQGPEDLVRYFERAAYRIAREEAGEQVDETFGQEFGSLHEQVQRYFRP